MKDNDYLKWVDYEDSIIPKLMYWPILLGSVTVITAVVLLPESKTIKFIKNQHQSFLLDTQLGDQETNFLGFNSNFESLIKPQNNNYQTLFAPISSFNTQYIYVK